jgi:DNA-binding IclR family transcriptional regulator
MARPSPSVDRVVAVLLLLSRHPGESFTLSEICRTLDMNVATAHSLLNSLVENRFLLRHAATKRYTLGPALIQVGIAAVGGPGTPLEHARAKIVAVAEALGRQCVASTVIGDEIVILAKSGMPGPLGLTLELGQRLKFLPPFGTVFAAWFDAEEIREWIGTSKAPHDPDMLDRCMRALATVRARGYAVGLVTDTSLMNHVWMGSSSEPDEESSITKIFEEIERNEYYLTELKPLTTYPVGNISAPVIGPDGRAVLALATPYFGESLSGATIEQHAETLREAASWVSNSIGGTSA